MLKLNFLKKKKVIRNSKSFWEWFCENENELFNAKIKQEGIFELLNNKLMSIHKNLMFTFSEKIKKGEKRKFIISAGGDKALIPYVECLYENSPELKRWEIIRYKPRMDSIDSFEICGEVISLENIKFSLFIHDKKIFLLFFVDGYENKNKQPVLQAALATIMDHLLGEYDAMTKIESCWIEPADTPFEKGEKYPLEYLQKAFDESVEKLKLRGI